MIEAARARRRRRFTAVGCPISAMRADRKVAPRTPITARGRRRHDPFRGARPIVSMDRTAGQIKDSSHALPTTYYAAPCWSRT